MWRQWGLPIFLLIMKMKLKLIAMLVLVTVLPMLWASCSKSTEKQFEELEALQKRDDDPIIFAAIRNRRADLVEFALKNRGARLETEDYYGNTPLVLAAELGDVPIMKMLMAAGANPKVSNRYGAPLTHVVAESGCVEAMKLLIQSGVDINERDLSGSFTVGIGFSSEVDSMLKRNGEDPVVGDQPIHVAAREGNVEMVKFLIASGVDRESKNLKGRTPLDCVGMKGLVDMGDESKGNHLAVVRIYKPDQQETPPEPKSKPTTNEDLQERFFGDKSK